jgi:hypothetical protein
VSQNKCRHTGQKQIMTDQATEQQNHDKTPGHSRTHERIRDRTTGYSITHERIRDRTTGYSRTHARKKQ